MRKTITFFLLIVGLQGQAQINVALPGLTDTTLNYLYIGIDNPISITGKGFKLSAIQINISGGGASLVKTAPGQYIARTTSITDECLMTIADQKGKLIANKTFKVRVVPPPIVTWAGQRDTILTKSRILTNPFLQIVFKDCYWNHRIRTTLFSTTFIQGSDSTKLFTSGYYLSEEQKKMIKDADKGTKVLFDDIRILGPDDGARKIPGFWIRIE